MLWERNFNFYKSTVKFNEKSLQDGCNVYKVLMIVTVRWRLSLVMMRSLILEWELLSGIQPTFGCVSIGIEPPLRVVSVGAKNPFVCSSEGMPFLFH